MDAAMRWIGHATHTVQDSFTPCHTARSGTRFETLIDVCTYGIEVPGVCLHAKPDLRDRIWETNLECTITSDRPWDCLVPQAQAASNATAGYLLVVGRLIKATDWDGAPAALETWFAGDPTNPESGYFLCNGLKNDGWEPGPDAGRGCRGRGCRKPRRTVRSTADTKTDRQIVRYPTRMSTPCPRRARRRLPSRAPKHPSKQDPKRRSKPAPRPEAMRHRNRMRLRKPAAQGRPTMEANPRVAAVAARRARVGAQARRGLRCLHWVCWLQPGGRGRVRRVPFRGLRPRPGSGSQLTSRERRSMRLLPRSPRWAAK